MVCLLAACAKGPDVAPVTAADVLGKVRASGAKVALVNVYATWCEPCRAEFPDLVRLEREYRGRGLKLVFVSVDDESNLPAVKRFLADSGVDFPSCLKSQKDMEFINGLEPRWDGSVPATLLYDGAGRQRDFWVGATGYEKLEKKIKSILEEKP